MLLIPLLRSQGFISSISLVVPWFSGLPLFSGTFAGWRAELQNRPKKQPKGGWVSSRPQKSVVDVLPVAITLSLCQNTWAGIKTWEQHILMDISYEFGFAILAQKWVESGCSWARHRAEQNRAALTGTHLVWHINDGRFHPVPSTHPQRFALKSTGTPNGQIGIGRFQVPQILLWIVVFIS